MGAAAVAGGLNLDNSELERMTAADATLRTNGSTHVDGVGSAATLNIAGNLILETGGGVRFLNAASVFGSLTVQANDGVQFEASVTTNQGDLQIVADANDTAESDDTIQFASGVSVQAADVLSWNEKSGNWSQ